MGFAQRRRRQSEPCSSYSSSASSKKPPDPEIQRSGEIRRLKDIFIITFVVRACRLTNRFTNPRGSSHEKVHVNKIPQISPTTSTKNEALRKIARIMRFLFANKGSFLHFPLIETIVLDLILLPNVITYKILFYISVPSTRSGAAESEAVDTH